MGKIPYCGKERPKARTYTWWTSEMVADLRKMKARGMTNESIAQEFGVTRGSVLHALARHPNSEERAHECQ